MTRIFIILSRYLIVLLCGLFAFVVAKSLSKGNECTKVLVTLQKIFIYLIHLILFAIIYLSTEDINVIFFYCFQILFFTVYSIVLPKIYGVTNKTLLNLVTFMEMVSFAILSRLSYTRAVKQFVICIVVSVATLVIPKIMEKSKNMRNYSYIYGVLGIGALGLVYIIGSVTYGAKLSIDLYIISIQPSEFVKISFIMFLSGILYKKKNIKGVLISGIFAAIHVILLVLSNDLGTALILCVVYLFLVYMATGQRLYLLGGLVAGSAASVVAYKLFYHVQTRVEAWVNPWPIIDGKGYQITQSLFAIGTGGLFGAGLFQGLPNDIPVVEQDFIFSALCEELGVFFGIFLILLSLSVFLVIIRISFNCKDEFYKLTTAALGVAYGFQIFLTVGGAIKLIPSTGVTYPLISYGGSSLFATLIVIAIVQGGYINEKKAN